VKHYRLLEIKLARVYRQWEIKQEKPLKEYKSSLIKVEKIRANNLSIR
jgi:hypothetical protein